MGAAEASLYPVIYATCIPRFFAAKDRARAIALLLTSLQVSAIIGGPLAGWCSESRCWGFKGWQVLFLIEAVPAIIFGFIIVFWMADHPRSAKWLTDEEKQFLTEQFEREVAAKGAVKRYSVVQALSDPEVLKLALIYFLYITGFWGFNYWMPTVLKSMSGWSNLAIGVVLAIPMLISLVASAYNGHSSSKRNEKRWHGAIPLFIGAIGLGVGVFMHNPVLAFFFVILANIGTYAPMAVWWSYPTTFLVGTCGRGRHWPD